jgi:alpha-1,3-glucan synthase
LNGREDGYIPPWYIILAVWPLAIMSFLFAYLMLYGLPGEDILFRCAVD